MTIQTGPAVALARRHWTPFFVACRTVKSTWQTGRDGVRMRHPCQWPLRSESSCRLAFAKGGLAEEAHAEQWKPPQVGQA